MMSDESNTKSEFCRASMSDAMVFRIMEPRGRERHRRAAHRRDRAGAKESNSLQLFRLRHSSAFGIRVLTLSSLPQRCADFCSGRWGKLESRRRNGRARLVRVRSHNSVAVRQQHIGAVDTQVVVDMQIKLLKYSLHRSSAR